MSPTVTRVLFVITEKIKMVTRSEDVNLSYLIAVVVFSLFSFPFPKSKYEYKYCSNAILSSDF